MGGDPAGAEDPDWAPQLPSIWDTEEGDEEDGEGDGEEGDLAGDHDPFAPPIPMATRAPDWLDPAAWVLAERGAGRALAEVAEAVARLDERLRRAPEVTCLAWRDRLALEDISALLWAEGVRLRPEVLALADADRIGRAEDADHVIARATWARRRLSGQRAVPVNVEDVTAFLGRVARHVETAEEDWRAVPEGLIPTGPDPHAAATFCTGLAALEPAHPLTRSAAAFHLWRGHGLSGPETWLEPAVIAARTAAAMARGGLSAVPVLRGAARPIRARGNAAVRLATWFSGLAQAADHAQMALDRIEAWQVRARDRASCLKGKGAPALIALLAARPVISAKDAATQLDLSPVQARTLLNRLHALGLTRELTGHTRFRFWTAKV